MVRFAKRKLNQSDCILISLEIYLQLQLKNLITRNNTAAHI
jgi:hypothetical protein